MTGRDTQTSVGQESGMVVIAMLAVTLPLLVLIAAASLTMDRRGKTQLAEVRNYRAFLAAESGIDELLYRARTGVLATKDEFLLDLGKGHDCVVQTVPQGSDGVDNDNDGLIDESDEDFLMVTVSGRYAGAIKRLSIRLRGSGGGGGVPLSVDGAVTFTGPTLLEMSGNSSIKGEQGFSVTAYDPNGDTSGGSTTDDTETAVAILYDLRQLIAKSAGELYLVHLQNAAGFVSAYLVAYSAGDSWAANQAKNKGRTAMNKAAEAGLDAVIAEPLGKRIGFLSFKVDPDSAALAAAIETTKVITDKAEEAFTGLLGSTTAVASQDPGVEEFTEQARTSGTVLTAGLITEPIGDGVFYRDGDIDFESESGGSGVLVVTGKLTCSSKFTWKGVVVVLGSFYGNGSTDIRGAMIFGPDATNCWMQGKDTVMYDPDLFVAVMGGSTSGPPKTYVTFDGWQEIGRYDEVPAK